MTVSTDQAVIDGFRDVLHRIVDRVGFPHEQEIVNSRAAIELWLGYAPTVAEYTGPLYDPQSGAYIGPPDHPANPANAAVAVPVAPTATVPVVSTPPFVEGPNDVDTSTVSGGAAPAPITPSTTLGV